jgi:hypothetical protein
VQVGVAAAPLQTCNVWLPFHLFGNNITEFLKLIRPDLKISTFVESKEKSASTSSNIRYVPSTHPKTKINV